MSVIIETLGGGEIGTGFWEPDTSRVRLGELPPMTTVQFVGYAAITLTQGVIPRLDTPARTEWARDMATAHAAVQNMPVLNFTGKFLAQDLGTLVSQIPTVEAGDAAELSAALSAAATPLEDTVVYYPENPFRVQPDGQYVGFVHDEAVRHVVTAEDFFNLAYHVLSGGIMGWGGHGTYQEVKDAAAHIHTALTG